MSLSERMDRTPLSIVGTPEAAHSVATSADLQFVEFLQKSSSETQNLFGRFIVKVEQMYENHPFDKDIIFRSLIFGTVAHQYNEVTKKRFRKEIRNGEPIPYIEHPIAMAERMVDTGIDGLTVAAALLHDVPEDVKMGDLQDSSEWLDAIQDVFNHSFPQELVGYAKDRHVGDVLRELIDGATEKKIPDGMNREDIRKISLHKMITRFVRDSKPMEGSEQPKLSEEELNTVDDVAFNLHMLFEKALTSPDHWRIFLLKSTDIWQNFQTIDKVKLIKVMRGRIAAGLCDWIGWDSMRSDIIEKLAEVTDTNTPFTPEDATPSFPTAADRDLREVTDGVLRVLTGLGSDGRFSSVFSDVADLVANSDGRVTSQHASQFYEATSLDFASDIGWPIPQVGDDFNRPWRKTTLPLPVVKIKVPTDDAKRFQNECTQHETVRVRVPADTQKGINTVEFRRYYQRQEDVIRGVLQHPKPWYGVHLDKKYLFNLIVEKSEAWSILDAFRVKTPDIDPLSIPEAGIFSSQLAPIEYDEKRVDAWGNHIDQLISFLYDPNLPFRRGRSPVVLGYNGTITFMDAELSLRNYYDWLGVPYVDEGKRHIVPVDKYTKGKTVVGLDMRLRSNTTLATRGLMFQDRLITPVTPEDVV